MKTAHAGVLNKIVDSGYALEKDVEAELQNPPKISLRHTLLLLLSNKFIINYNIN